MPRRASLLVIMVTALLIAPQGAVGSSYAPDGSNSCLSATLTVTHARGTTPGDNLITATVEALGVPGQRVSRLHLDLQIQERTATAWMPFTTPQHAATYKLTSGSRIHRTWTLREDAGPIDALLADHVQMRVYAKFRGVCRGASLGPPLLAGLGVPTLPQTSPGS